jgi:cobyrinic acid a,c-diamide synthase
MARFLIAAAHKSSGKTVISTGLAGALSATGRKVQCFKKGPDYIDPMWLAAASGRACYNLDFNTMNGDAMTGLVLGQSSGADLAMIEANKGLFDGVDPKGSDSNAELAKQLKTPVVLVIDTTGMTRGIAPLLLGYCAFDADVNIAGVILNKVGGARHEAKLRAALETYCDIPVLGAVWRDPALDIGERHLGLTTPAESTRLEQMIAGFSRIVGDAVDLDRLLDIADTAPALAASARAPVAPQFPGLRIAIARDASFGFYYPDDLQAFAAAGATLVPFDATTAPALPEADGLFIGGGFPEVQMAALAQNAPLRADIKTKIERGLPAYAECGGLMYLCRSLSWRGETQPMCDVIAGDAVMCERPQGRGYTRFRDSASHPWGPQPEASPAHEFHYARVDHLPDETVFARRILRGHGVDGARDAIIVHNLLAGFCHLRNTPDNPWVARFLAFVAGHKNAGN